MGFGKKILIGSIAIFAASLACIYPFATHAVQRVVNRELERRSASLIEIIRGASSERMMIKRLKSRKETLIFQIALISDDGIVLYDSFTHRKLGELYGAKEAIAERQDVIDAQESGVGYEEEVSPTGEPLSSIARSFLFQGRTYTLRTSVLLGSLQKLIDSITEVFFFLIIAVLTIFSVMMVVFMMHISRPLHLMLAFLRPYSRTTVEKLPPIKLPMISSRSDDIGKLAALLERLSQDMHRRIDTMQHITEEREEFLESLVEGIIAVDDEMCIYYTNDIAAEMIGIDKKDLVGRRLSDVRNEELSRSVQESQRESSIVRNTVTIEGKEGALFLDVVVSPLAHKRGIIVALHDRSTYYKLLEMRKNFIANASHELKTPITIIQGFAETAYDNPTLPSKKRAEIMEKIMRNCIKMTTLIDNLLALSDIESISERRLQECDLRSLIDKCRAQIVERYPNTRIVYESFPPEGAIIHADRELLEHALENIFTNAVKYSEPPADISVAVAQAQGSVTIAITDKGIGIPRADLEHVFDRFYCVDKARSKKLGGSGLGLSIVKTIVEKHQGNISVASSEGKGSTFTITLPENG